MADRPAPGLTFYCRLPHPYMTTSHLALGNQALKANDFDRALQHYRAAQSAHPALAHLLKANIELVERRLRAAPAQGREQTPAVSTTIDIVVPVFNALEDVKRCLASLEQHTDGMRVRVIVVNDGSDADTTQWLRAQCQGKPLFTLIEHAQNQGYTRAVNTGLRASTAEFVITQNSDTIVTPGWLQGMVRCMASHPKIGVVGPLSNAASWQNVPQLRDASGNFAVNELPNGMTPEAMAALVARVSQRHYPRLPFVNGFCFMIRRAVIDAIGYMDEENFPVGYGEENDFCIRAIDAGFELAIADDVFVFHAKSKSFGHERRKTLSEQGTRSLKHKHTPEKYAARVEAVKRTEALDAVRARIQAALAPQNSADAIDLMSMRVLFLLPVKGGGGGAHSVVQEVTEMRRLGIHARVAVKHEQVEGFLKSYADIPGAENTFVGFDDHSLIDLAEDYDVVVGTIFTSMKLVKRIVDVSPHILPAYYVQDYEPMFFEEGTPQWHEARESYTLVPGAFLFAKTHWIIDEVKRQHGVTVHKVQPSIDHEVYKPAQRVKDGRLHVTAMIRPQTPYRGAARTMRVLAQLANQFGDHLQIHIFGCPSDHPEFKKLELDFQFKNHGTLLRPQVASLLAQSDLFIDLSDYQAFGRTALEAMSCGCASVVPIKGGANEYAKNHETAVIVDTANEEATYQAIKNLLTDTEKLRQLQLNGMATAAQYSVHSAAVSECLAILPAARSWRTTNPKRAKPTLILLPSYRSDGLPTGSGYVRVLLPYNSKNVLKNWRVRVSNQLPNPGSALATLIQREAIGHSVNELEKWIAEWKSNGGKLIYEIDDDLLDVDGLKARHYKGDLDQTISKVRLLAKSADLIHVSTPHLASKLKKLNPQVQVINNGLCEKLWHLDLAPNKKTKKENRTENAPIRIGYIGTPTHDEDLALISEAMRNIEKEFGNKIEIEIIGGFQNTHPTFGKRVGLPKNNQYPNFVEWLHKRAKWDVGIIPLAPNNFNKSKSHLKFLEYAALNLAIVVSNFETYHPIAKNNINSLTPGPTKTEWIDALRRIIEDEKLRDTLATNARQEVIKNHTLESIGVQISKSLDKNLLHRITHECMHAEGAQK